MFFRLWAPKQNAVSLEIEGRAPVAMIAAEGGWREIKVEGVGPGARYRFRLEDGLAVPDPASRFQPEDVHGPSEVVDPAAYAWKTPGWRGRPWEECVLYELHVGAFTSEGTYAAAAEKLDHLADLGVTAVELMPIADFPGARNWGYDGALPYAPDAAYGRPEDLKGFIDAAHARGLMVFLDVVYNHFGPDGNYLPLYAPIFTDRHKTPWGGGIDYDGPHSRPVRELAIENALYWLDEYRFDGLRLDAVHAIMDDTDDHLLRELARRVRTAFPERHIHLVLENEENEPALLQREGGRHPQHYTAQWNDDVHHVLHTAVTGESAGYYAAYAGDAGKLARGVAEGFVFQGEHMEYRGSPRGGPSGDLPPSAFVAFLQNHDQVGNRAFGDRITASARPEAVEAALAVLLLLPQIPMLFMGEEWASASPFPFFCDFGPELGEAVRKGRREEFARFPEFQDEASRARIPDPTAESTFQSAKLDWDALSQPAHAARLAFVKKLLRLRRDRIIPLLPALKRGGAGEVIGPSAVSITWQADHGRTLRLLANLSPQPAAVSLPKGESLFVQGALADKELGPWTAAWWLGAS
ncbi:malto-oligosyltrehalose trehalohydrolase [Alsobacter metallidurans]|uniref:Malto-oligosyltrehalose trehalohydrolase n=1 Tax=Alsobacter metallidurans TaxID=340221 RepID=A0A917I335_9HYPH|nr:malto-oligosyltrehalose trehalohydrolase [Alsobacter metallidurans]GGH08959.1 malto-oligosyltrehalose trehalohydrolase [Alsobacter metallidurans]